MADGIEMNITFPVQFTKMSGAGNDFILIDHRQSVFTKEEKVELTKAVCRRCFSVGADGVIFIEGSETADFSWDFYNSDGSVAEMCGNGSRCAARFAHDRGIAGSVLSFETIAGIIRAEVFDDNSVKLNMTEPFDFKKGQPVELDGQQYDTWFVNTGVPHVIIFVDDEYAPVEKWGRQVRFDQQFQPAGTNVNFVTARPDGSFRSRTYERGVEEETRACGTGAVASALYVALTDRGNSPVQIVTSGGEELLIDFELTDGPTANKVTMQGPARYVYEGQLNKESIL